MKAAQRHLELRLLWPFLLMALAAWGFLEIASEVLEGSTRSVDQWILQQLRTGEHGQTPVGPKWLQEGMRDITALGGLAVASGLKVIFSQSRPDALFHATVASGYSFPSGHAMMSAIVYLTLAALVARLVPRTRLRLHVMGTAAVLTGLVGVSWVYLGVHWASDVLAGWAAGAAWALLCWLTARHLHLGQERSQ